MCWKTIYRALLVIFACGNIIAAANEAHPTPLQGYVFNNGVGHPSDIGVVSDRIASTYVVVKDIQFTGNTKTRSDILHRELQFEAGDSLPVEQLEELVVVGSQNLMNTQLFNFVDAEIDTSKHPDVVVTYAVVERWYTWPIPILEIKERTLNEWIQSPSLSKLNYGISLLVGNFSGRNERFTIQLKMGYMQKYSISYRSPYLNKAQNLAWGFEGGMERSREMAYLTEENQQLFYKSNAFVFRKNFGQFSMYYRPGVFGRHSVHFGIQQYGFADTLKILNPRFVPGRHSWFNYMNAGYEYIYEKRDNKAYPLRGHYGSFSARRLGMGLLTDEKMDVNVMQASWRMYRELAPRWFFANGLMLKWSDGSNMSYFNQQGLGLSNNLVRGYHDYVIDGQSFVVLKASGKYELLPKRISRLPYISSEKFSRIHYAMYLTVFADAGYAYDRYFYDNNPLNNKVLAGCGFGIDFVTYYDKVFRMEFSVNRHGEYGVFLHLVAPF